jgi:hypothetical protein
MTMGFWKLDKIMTMMRRCRDDAQYGWHDEKSARNARPDGKHAGLILPPWNLPQWLVAVPSVQRLAAMASWFG